MLLRLALSCVFASGARMADHDSVAGPTLGSVQASHKTRRLSRAAIYDIPALLQT